jgi:hypothetical protein
LLIDPYREAGMSDKNEDPSVPTNSTVTDHERVSQSRKRLAVSYDLLRETAALLEKEKASSPGGDGGKP